MTIIITIAVFGGVGLIAAIIASIVPGLRDNSKKQSRKDIAKQNVESVIVTVEEPAPVSTEESVSSDGESAE